MKTLTKSILLTAILSSSSAYALEGDTWLNIHIGSLHSDAGFEADDTEEYFEWNEVNPGLGYEWEATDNKSYRLGAYHNSVDETSVYAGLNLHTKYTSGIAVGVMLGFVNGYERHGMKVAGIVLPNVMFIYERVRLEVGYIPAMNGYGSVTTFSTGIKF